MSFGAHQRETARGASWFSKAQLGQPPVSPGSFVNFIISQGPTPVPVPNVVGQTQAVAEATLAGASLELGTVVEANDATVPAGQVISQYPAAGLTARPGSRVNVTLSIGPVMVTVPNVTPDTPSLRKNPVFMYFQDNFQKPAPFEPHVAVSIDDTYAKKIDGLDAHVSQFYEWLPWLDGRLEEVPKDKAARKEWLAKARAGNINPAVRASLVKWYGADAGAKVKYAEAFEICEYGSRPTEADIKRLFPFLGK